MQEIIELKEDFEKSEERKNELENQIELMRNDLLRAQSSLSRLEQFETEKLRLKEDLELKIEEFNMLTEHYQHEKEEYLNVLEHVQDKVNVYKKKSQKFDAEKGSWSKQIDELKTELSQTKATLVRMEELEQKNAQLAAELQAKEVEIYKIKKENERAINQQLEQFKLEMKLYQDKIAHYEKDREIWEKQMKQMRAQFAGLEANLEEKENFIKQFIKQPLSQSTSVIQPSTQQILQTSPKSIESIQPSTQQILQTSPKSVESIQPSTQQILQTSPNYEESIQPQKKPEAAQTSQQQGEWFLRMSQQQSAYQPGPQKPKVSNSSSMDFFTLRNKTTQASYAGPIYGNQWDQE